MAPSILSVEAFETFRAAVGAPGKVVPGLARASDTSKGVLKDTR